MGEKVFMCILVLQMPAWSYFNQDIAVALGMESITDTADLFAGAAQKLEAAVYIRYASHLGDKFLSALSYIS